jgi:proteasome beta subunit
MNYEKIAGKAMKGTTTIGIICSDGVVMGADSRATMDTFIASSEAVKIYKINDKLGLTVAGDVGSAEYLAKLLQIQNSSYMMEEKVPLNPTSATSILHIILQENKMFPFLVQLLVGGFNRDTPELYSIDPIGGYIKESKFASTGSGSLTALGYLEDNYKKDMTTQEATKIVAKGLKIAMKRDSATGDRLNIVTITKNGYRELSGDEIEKLLK